MKKKLLDFLVFAVLTIILLGVTALIPRFFSLLHLSNIANSFALSWLIKLLRVAIFIFFLLGVTYNRLWNKQSLSTGLGKFSFYTLLTLVFFFTTTAYYLLADFAPAYYTVVKKAYNTEYYTEGEPYMADETTGFTLIPNNQVYHVSRKTGNKSLFLKVDENGCRVTNNFTPENYLKKPLVLFLGCSFTYGHRIDSTENTFPYLSGVGLNGYSINGAVAGFGLSQMLVRAQKLIPKYKPDVVVVQYSPWLVNRATGYYSPSTPLKLTTSYFTQTDDSIEFCTPAFSTIQYNPVVFAYRNTKPSKADYLSFLFKVAAPAFYHDLFAGMLLPIKEWLHITPKPAENKAAVEQYVYSRIYAVCRQNNSNMAVLNLGNNEYTKGSHALMQQIGDVTFIEADSVLASRVKSFKEYNKAYGFWEKQGTDSILVDRHINLHANRLVSDAVISTLKPILSPATHTANKPATSIP